MPDMLHDVTIVCVAVADRNEQGRCLMIREAVYEGKFDEDRGLVRDIPLADAVMQLMAEWRARCKRIGSDDLVFSTWSGKSRLGTGALAARLRGRAHTVHAHDPDASQQRRYYNATVLRRKGCHFRSADRAVSGLSAVSHRETE